MDFIDMILCEKYGARRDPNAFVETAPIDIYDLAKLAIKLDAEVKRLNGIIDSKLFSDIERERRRREEFPQDAG